MDKVKIPKRLSTALINSLTAGVVPRIGLEYITVGRKKEIEAILNGIGNVAEGGAFFKFIIGRYGSGKSFMLQVIRNYAMEREYVVADADLSPERKLTGMKGQGLATYRELMQHLSTRTRPDGGALGIILDRWISGIQAKVLKETGLRPNDPAFDRKVEESMMEMVNSMEGMVHGFDFASVLTSYWKGYRNADEPLKDASLRWLRGEFSTKTEARSVLDVRVIIDDDNWYDYIKLMASFISSIGYKGLILLIDEAVNLYKIINSLARNSNYEKLLSMFNDTMQGKAGHLGILMGGTPQFLEDTRRGLFSYEALRSRLEESRFIREGLVDMTGPIIRLQTLSSDEIFVLLHRIQDVHSSHFGYEPRLSQQDYIDFMQEIVNRVGAEKLLTPREVVRDFISILNILLQNPEMSFSQVLHGNEVQFSTSKEPAASGENTGGFAEFSL